MENMFKSAEPLSVLKLNSNCNYHSIFYKQCKTSYPGPSPVELSLVCTHSYDAYDSLRLVVSAYVLHRAAVN